MGRGGEIFVLNMGIPIKVAELAHNLIVLNGLLPGKDIEIKYPGMRPGEKMYEELFRPEDIHKDTGHPDIFMAVPEEGGGGKETDELAAPAGRAAGAGAHY